MIKPFSNVRMNPWLFAGKCNGKTYLSQLILTISQNNHALLKKHCTERTLLSKDALHPCEEWHTATHSEAS